MNIAIIGSGNAAWYFAYKLSQKHLPHHLTIHHRNELSAEWNDLEVRNTTSETIDPNTDLVILSVADDAISEVVSNYTFPESGMVVHTAGSISIEVLQGASFARYGVLYPLQSLTKGLVPEKVPILIETYDESSLPFIQKIAREISDMVEYANSIQRSKIHLAAVFASNFINHQMVLAETLTKENGISMDILAPLIRQSVEKALTIGPMKAQTGPAVRGDQQTIEKHVSLLKDPEMRELYHLLSKHIQHIHKV